MSRKDRRIYLGSPYWSSVQTLKVEQTLLQAVLLHRHLDVGHLLHGQRGYLEVSRCHRPTLSLPRRGIKTQ